ncbi:hypothetical protein [Pseudomonas caricapapayae]|uniref:hypothetical protein n=1 Tax=Pseudomonas caricapapayae TaxID=46678 RepID=UPI000EFF5B0E|nr:hypothetical protein [Pseudomonas caricapapayae]
MDKKDFSRKENLWLIVIVAGVFSLSNFSARYPILFVVQIALLIILIGYTFFRIIQMIKSSRGRDKSTGERFQKLLEDPKAMEALEASLKQSKTSEDDKPHDEPRLIRAFQEVRKHRK